MKKTIITALFAMALLSNSACGSTESSESATDNNEPTSAETTVVEETTKSEWFITEYNKVAPNPIADAVEIDVLDQEAGHYRTEFRLHAFSNSNAQTGKLGDTIVDVVDYGKDNSDLRIYADGITLDQAKEIITFGSPILDEDMPPEELNDVLAYIDKYEDANGQLFGDLCVVLLGSHQNGFEFMLKLD